jgi:transposase
VPALLGHRPVPRLLGAVVVVIGVDSYKRTHTVVALDPVGRRLAEKTVSTDGEGHLALVAWAGR